MKAATCVADITPKCAVHLCGYVGEARKYTAKGIHDHPLAVSLLLEIDGVRLLFISIDVITLGGEKAAVIKDKIQKILTIENDHIIISAIHTHSGANGLDDMTVFGTPDNPEYFAYVCEQITDSIQHLEQQLCEVQAYITTGKVHGYYSNGRINICPLKTMRPSLHLYMEIRLSLPCAISTAMQPFWVWRICL